MINGIIIGKMELEFFIQIDFYIQISNIVAPEGCNHIIPRMEWKLDTPRKYAPLMKNAAIQS